MKTVQADKIIFNNTEVKSATILTDDMETIEYEKRQSKEEEETIYIFYPEYEPKTNIVKIVTLRDGKIIRIDFIAIKKLTLHLLQELFQLSI